MAGATGGVTIGERVLDSLGWGVMVVGRWSRVIFSFNRGMVDITGVPAETAVGRSVVDLFRSIQGLDFEAMDQEIRATGHLSPRSLRLVRASGEVIYRHLRGDVLQGVVEGEEAVVVSLQDVTEREVLRLCMSRYLAREVVEYLLACRAEGPVAGREVEVAVLAADMRDFTAAAEGLTPDELFEVLNAYLGAMVEVLARHQGVVDKFTGDGFLAVFGWPVASGREAERALTAALELAQAVDGVSGEREARGLPTLSLGYGVHWGPAVAGSLGSLVRMEYTVVGDTVNLAHRVQALAAAGEVLVTREATAAAGDGFRWGEPRWIRVRGRKAPVKVRPLLGRELPS